MHDFLKFVPQFQTMLPGSKPAIQVPPIPNEIGEKIAGAFADIAHDDALRQNPSLTSQEAHRAAARAMAPLMLVNRKWALYVRMVKGSPVDIEVGMQTTKAAIEHFAEERNPTWFRRDIAYLLTHSSNVEVPFARLNPMQEQIVLQEMLIRSSTFNHLRLNRFRLGNTPYISAICEKSDQAREEDLAPLSVHIRQDGRELGDHEAQLVTDAVMASDKIHGLDLSWNNISAIKLAEIQAQLDARQPVLATVNLQWNGMRRGVKDIVENSIKNAPPEAFELNLVVIGLNLNALEMRAIADEIKKTGAKFSRLYMNHHPIGNDGAHIVADLIKAPECGLMQIGLANTGMDNVGMEVIAEAVKDHPNQLRSLNLVDNMIADTGGEHVAGMIGGKHCRLDAIRLRGNPIGADTRRFIIASATMFRPDMQVSF